MTDGGFEIIIEGLAERGWAAVPKFLPASDIIELLEEERVLWQKQAFRAAGIGRGAETAVHPEIRGDRICWLDPAALPEAVSRFWSKIDELRAALNRTLYMGLRDFEAHFAVYPPGAFYRKHLDQHRGTPHRAISCLLYLNEDWSEADGGHLRLYDGESYEDLLPEAGTFVCFRSELVLHEVLPTRRERVSLTGWLRRG